MSLVSILDADKEGFLRSSTSLIQTIGRAARNVSGAVHMYADTITPSMERAIEETNRRRDKQVAYNAERGLDPAPLRKRIADITDMLAREDNDTESLIGGGRQRSRGKAPVPGMRSAASRQAATMAGALPSADLADLIQQLTDQMHLAARELQFELAARLRDEIAELKRLRQCAPPPTGPRPRICHPAHDPALGRGAWVPSPRHASAAAEVATFAWCNLCNAISLGGVSSCFTH